MSTWKTLQAHLASAWQQRPVRERRLLLLGLIVLLFALVWGQVLAPAWQLWHEAPLRQATLEAQTHQMRQLQAEAQQLQAPRHIDRAQALRLLNTSANNLLGQDAQLTAQGNTLRVSFHATPATHLAQWLAQAREQALSLPSQAQLQRQEGTESEPLWHGTLVLRLP